MGLDSIKNQLVSELPLSVSATQRDAQKLSSLPGQDVSLVDRSQSETEKTGEQYTSAHVNKQDPAVLKQQLDSLNTQLSSSAIRFEFVEELGTSVVKVVDVTDNKTIRQIPSEEMIKRLKDIRAYLEQHIYNNSSNLRSPDQIKETISGILLNHIS